MKKLSFFCLLATLAVGSVHMSWGQMVQNVSMPITSSSKEAVSTFNKGLALFDLGEQKKAKALFEKAVEQDPKLCIGYIYLSLTDFTPKTFTDNLNKAKANLATASEWEKLHYELFESFARADMEQRMKTAQQMVAKFPNSARAYLQLGYTYDDARDINKAREHYKKVITLAPDWVVGYNALANSYLFSEPKDFSLAEQNARKVVKLSPEHRSAYILLGDAYKAQNKLEEAQEAFTKAIQLDPNTPNAYYGRGSTYNLLGNYDAARQDFQQAAKNEDMPSTPIERIAISYLYQNEPQKALQLLMTESEKMNIPNNAAKTNSARYYLLNTAFMIAYFRNDVKSLSDILQKMEPASVAYFNDWTTPEAKQFQKAYMLNLKAMIQSLQGDFTGAMANAETVKKAMKNFKDPRFAEIYHSLAGHINYKKKDFERAISHFKQTDKQSVYDRYWLAKAYEGGGKKDQAMEIYKDIADYNFDDAGYAMIRNEVKQKVKDK